MVPDSPATQTHLPTIGVWHPPWFLRKTLYHLILHKTHQEKKNATTLGHLHGRKLFSRISLFNRSHVLPDMAVGQNLRYLFSRDYLLFKRLLRVTGGTGFGPTVICFSLCFLLPAISCFRPTNYPISDIPCFLHGFVSVFGGWLTSKGFVWTFRRKNSNKNIGPGGPTVFKSQASTFVSCCTLDRQILTFDIYKHIS